MKLKCWEIEDIRTRRVNVVRAKSSRTLEKRLGGKRYSEVLVRQVKCELSGRQEWQP